MRSSRRSRCAARRGDGGRSLLPAARSPSTPHSAGRPHPGLPRPRERDEGAYGPALAMATWFVLPIIIAFALTQPRLNLHLFSNRYLAVVVPPLCLLAGFGVSAVRWRAVQSVLAIGLVVVALPQLLHYYASPHLQDIRGAARWIEARYQSGDGL